MWKKRQRSVLFSHVLPNFQLVSNVNVFFVWFFSLIRILNDYPQRAATAACLLLMVEPGWCGPSRTPPVLYINMIYFFFNGKRSCLDPLNTKGTFIGYITHTHTHAQKEREGQWDEIHFCLWFYQMVLKIISAQQCGVSILCWRVFVIARFPTAKACFWAPFATKSTNIDRPKRRRPEASKAQAHSGWQVFFLIGEQLHQSGSSFYPFIPWVVGWR